MTVRSNRLAEARVARSDAKCCEPGVAAEATRQSAVIRG